MKLVFVKSNEPGGKDKTAMFEQAFKKSVFHQEQLQMLEVALSILFSMIQSSADCRARHTSEAKRGRGLQVFILAGVISAHGTAGSS